MVYRIEWTSSLHNSSLIFHFKQPEMIEYITGMLINSEARIIPMLVPKESREFKESESWDSVRKNK